MIRTTIKNWYSENKTLAAILIGMIGLPVALFAVAGVYALAIIIFSFFFGKFFGAVIVLMMTVGAIGGYIWSLGK
jgi:uncharacterized membrane protein YqjE